MDELSEIDRFELASDMAVAAIIGKDIYNFGEVLATPVLKYLRGTRNEWLESLIVALNEGEVATLNRIVAEHEAKFADFAVLQGQMALIHKKSVILCIMNMAFERPSHERIISFEEICQRTLISPDQVRDGGCVFCIWRIVVGI